MKEKIVKKLPLIEAILLVVIALLIVIASFMPAIKLNTEDYSIESFTQGSLTADIPVGEVKVGTFILFDMLSNMKEYNYVVKVQSIESDIRELEKSKNDGGITESAQNKLDDLRKELLELEVDFSEDEDNLEKLDELLKDDGFINALAFRSLIGDLLVNSIGRIGEAPVGFSVMAIFFVILLVGVVALSVATLIGFIKKLIYFVKIVKNPDAEKVEELAPKKVAVVAPILMIATLGAAKFLIGGASVLGAGAILGLILCLVSYIVRIVNKVIFSEEKEKVKLVAKSAMSLLSVILALVFVLNLFAMDIVGSLFDNFEAFVGEYVSNNLSKNAVDDAEGIFGTQVWIAVGIGVIAFLVSLIALGNCVERFGMKLVKYKDGTIKPYKPCRVLSIFMLVLTIATCFLGVSTADERDEASADGSVKILWDAYKLEDTVEYNEYEALVEAKEAEQELLEELKEELKDEDDEDAKKLLENSVFIAEKSLEKTEKTIESLETSHKLNMVVCIITSVLFIVLEYTYNKIPDIFEAKLGDKFKKKKKAESVEA